MRVLQAIEGEGVDALVGAFWSDKLGELRTLFIDIGTQAEDVVSQSVRVRINHEVQDLLGRPGQDVLVEATLPLDLGLVTRHSPATVWPSLMLLRKVVELLEPTVAWETTVENLDHRATYRRTGRAVYEVRFQQEETPWRDIYRTVVLGPALRKRLDLLSPQARRLPDIYAWFADGPMLWLMGPDTFEMTYATVHVQVAGPEGPFLMSFDDPWMAELLYETGQRHRKALQELLRPLREEQTPEHGPI
ncbi:hypothetical protein [Deinococcus aetherius]|nr:hypothetical protein [Deinococcus aetherius]